MRWAGGKWGGTAVGQVRGAQELWGVGDSTDTSPARACPALRQARPPLRQRTLANAEPPSALTASTKQSCRAGDQRRRSRLSMHTRSGSASPATGIATSSLLAELARPPLALEVRVAGLGGGAPEVGGPAGSPAEGLAAGAGPCEVCAAAAAFATPEQPAGRRAQ